MYTAMAVTPSALFFLHSPQEDYVRHKEEVRRLEQERQEQKKLEEQRRKEEAAQQR